MAKRLSNIIDPRTGEPFETDVINSVQTDDARISALHQRYDNHPSSGLTPHKLAQIMNDGEQGMLTDQAELSMDMEEKDGHLFAELQKRKLACTTVPWKIVPPINATKQEMYITEWLEERLASLDLPEIVLDMADAILKGYSAQTIQWELIEGAQTPVALNWVSQSWFTTAKDNRNQLQLLDNDGKGQDLWAGGWVVHAHKSKSGYVGRAGLVRTLAWPYLFKNYSLRDLAEFLEIYGLPLRLGKYPSGASESEKSKLLRAVIEIGHNAAGIIPDSMALEFKEAAKGQADPFLALINWAERTTSKAILGATLTSGTDGGGAYALGEVHNEVRQDLRDADVKQFGKTLTRDLIWPMVVFNHTAISSYHRCPKLEFITEEPEDIKLLSQSLPGLQKLGMKISKKWLHKQTQIPQPDDEDDVLEPLGETKPSTQPPAAMTAALTYAPAETDLPSPAQQLGEQALNEIDLSVWMQRLEALMAQSDSLESFRDAVYNGFGELPTEVMQQPLVNMLLSANLAGRLDVEEESRA